jgi:WhiB family transcriptional regulator, redox-sensing transcriptional regulator
MTSTAPATEWRSLGACLTADPDLFFPISSVGPGKAQTAQAKVICGTCRVQQQCLSFALETDQVHGVWGGVGPEERRALRRRPRAA